MHVCLCVCACEREGKRSTRKYFPKIIKKSMKVLSWEIRVKGGIWQPSLLPHWRRLFFSEKKKSWEIHERHYTHLPNGAGRNMKMFTLESLDEAATKLAAAPVMAPRHHDVTSQRPLSGWPHLRGTVACVWYFPGWGLMHIRLYYFGKSVFSFWMWSLYPIFKRI